MTAAGSAFPESLDVSVTRKHLDGGSRYDRNKSPLMLAFKDALSAAGIHFSAVTAAMDASIRVYHSHPEAHDARYCIPAKGVNLIVRHTWGARVKPCTVTLEAVYRRENP